VKHQECERSLTRCHACSSIDHEATRTFGWTGLGDDSVNQALQSFAQPEPYWSFYFDIIKQSREAVDNAGIEIPFPQTDAHQKN